MARKVFISILGTGFYSPCQYTAGKFTSSPTRFIQQAMLEKLGVKESWGENDVVYILLTDKARRTNWEVEGNIRNNSRTKQEETYVGLRAQIAQMQLPMGEATQVKIPDGNSEAEIWEIFDTLYGLMQEGDEVHLDLTHSFRSLPMLMLVWSNYTKFLRHVKVASISYGNFEARRQSGDNSGDYEKAPIIDLLPLSVLQDWTFATANYIKNGDLSQLKKLSEEQLNPILKTTQGRDLEAKNLKSYVKELQSLTDDIRYVRGVALYQADDVRKVKERGRSFERVIIKPLAPIIGQINESLVPFSELSNSATNGLIAARWCINKGLYQAAVTHLLEGVVTFFCSRHHTDVYNQNGRAAVNRAIKKHYYELNPHKGSYKESDSEVLEQLVNELGGDPLMQSQELVAGFVELEGLRNDFNHAGMRNNPRQVKKLLDQVSKYVDELTQLLILPPLLLNLSNHPYNEWGERQREAARIYGDCQDMPFPQIDAAATTADICTVARKIADEIRPFVLKYDLTVHLMGEMGFTYSLLSLLQRMGVRCIYSTSQRLAEALPDGSKRSEFRFERFREYELLS